MVPGSSVEILGRINDTLDIWNGDKFLIKIVDSVWRAAIAESEVERYVGCDFLAHSDHRVFIVSREAGTDDLSCWAQRLELRSDLLFDALVRL